jgi:hypothetical protein
MPELAKALTVRLFGTPLLAAESALVLASLAIFLYQTPFIIAFVAIAAFLAGAWILVAASYGVIFFIIPGLIIFVVGIGGLVTLLTLFCRGYKSVSIHYLNWLRKKYYLAKEDIALNDLFASEDPLYY